MMRNIRKIVRGNKLQGLTESHMDSHLQDFGLQATGACWKLAESCRHIWRLHRSQRAAQCLYRLDQALNMQLHLHLKTTEKQKLCLSPSGLTASQFNSELF